MKKGPHWPLDRIKTLVRENKIYIQRKRALDFFPTLSEALDVATSALLDLKTSDFAHTVQLTWDVADVYGVRIDDAGWYLKITIDEDEPEVAIISFHPLERAIKTFGGEVKP
jgi:hypothetical protein